MPDVAVLVWIHLMGKRSILELNLKVSRNFIGEKFSVGLLINLGL